MRVISGTVGGFRLHVPRGGVRPTMDRVKAAIFSSLGERVPGARVLDLFAGSGALGIEALSRGAACATFIESDAEAVRCIERNLEKTTLTSSATVVRRDVFSFLDKNGVEAGFDLIFADPPYVRAEGDRDFSTELLHCQSLVRALDPRGVFILEKQPDREIKVPETWRVLRSRRYGATETVMLEAPR